MQVTIHEAKTHLSRLIEKALLGEEVIISKRDQPLIRLQVIPKGVQKRKLGWAKKSLLSIAEDFDAPLDDFKDYMNS